jgi:hypothetical protein
VGSLRGLINQTFFDVFEASFRGYAMASSLLLADGAPEKPLGRCQRQGRKKEAGIRETGVPSLEDAFRDGPHVQYLSQYEYILLEMRGHVQYPPPGMFTYKDLTWLRAEDANVDQDTISIDLEKVPETSKRKAMKQVVLIPWDRVADFRDGEQKSRKDVETKFVRTKSDSYNVGQIKAYRWNVYIEYERYEFPETFYRFSVMYSCTPCSSHVTHILLFAVGGNASTGQKTSLTLSSPSRRTSFCRLGNTTTRKSASRRAADRKAPI